LYILKVHLQPRKSVKEYKTYTCCSQSSIHNIFYINENVLARLVNEVYSDKVEPFVTHLNMVCTTVFRVLPTVNVTSSFNLKVTASNLLQAPHIFSSSLFSFCLIYRFDLSLSLSLSVPFLHFSTLYWKQTCAV